MAKKRLFDFTEVVTYNHAIAITADSEEVLSKIENSIICAIESEEFENKADIFKTIKAIGGSYEFIEDGSPEVQFEI